MSNKRPSSRSSRLTKERLRLGEVFSGVATFAFDPVTNSWDWSDHARALFGGRESWENAVFPDDLLKLRLAVEGAAQAGGEFGVELRARHPDNELRWITVRGQRVDVSSSSVLCGAAYDISDRKRLEARLLATNETLEARVAEARQEARNLEVLNQTGIAVAAEHDLERLVQMVTDAGVELTHAQFGAFFYNVLREDGEAYTLYTLSGVPRESFARFPMPRNTAIFEPTFRGRGPVRSDDILADARYGKNPPYKGMPEGHLPVRSYLAIPVKSRSGEVLGGLFFGHAQPHVFSKRAERIVTALAAQAAVAVDNAHLHQTSMREIAARSQAESALSVLNQELEQRAEERAKQLAASVSKLEDTERRFRILVEGVTDYAIYMLDKDGYVANWNPGAERAKGYSREEILGQHFSRFYTPEDRAAGTPSKAISTAAATGKYEAEGWRVRKDGSRFWASVVINAIKDREGEILGFAKITRDLTERRAADERTRQAQKMEAVGHLTGGVAHDFNNLLTIIIGNLETLQRDLPSASQADLGRLKRSADNAMQGARRAESLRQRLLAFSRQQPLQPKDLDLGRLVTGMSDLFRRTLGEQVTVETVLGGGLWRAEADPNQLELAILNLAVNARDAMPNGGRLTIETGNVYFDEHYAASQAEVLPGQYVMLAITDTGCGMSPEVQAKAFDPFFTTKDVGHGTGLGLSQVYGFVKQSRGHVKIYSEVGEGTTIKLYLPRVHAVSQDQEEIVPKVASGSKGETILVVEDDEDVRTYSCDSLKELGYTVLQAERADTALRLLATQPEIAVLFTDVGLPGGMNGRQLVDEARKRRNDLKVLFTSGYARNAIVHDGRLDPGVELLPKPFSRVALASKLRDILDTKRVPGRILLVEDEILIQMLATDYLQTAGFTVEAAGSASEAMNKLSQMKGGVDAVIVDLGLPDRKGDLLIREIRAQDTSLPILLATGQTADSVRDLFNGDKRIGFVSKPYVAADLTAALRALGLRAADT
jgi:PAS domain S-box-containing protein